MPGKRKGYDAACYYAGKCLGHCTKSDSKAYVLLMKSCGGDAARVLKEYAYFSPELKGILEKAALMQAAYCPVCKAPMEYDYVHYNHIGAYRCTRCGHKKPATDYTVTAADLAQGRLTIDGSITIQLAFRSIYNVYNILAAYAACREMSIAADTAAGVINNYILKNGRMQKFTLGSHRGVLLTSKHENSIAYDTNLRYIASSKDPCVVLVIVDAVSRKYFTSETSWLWDIDFDQLNREQVRRVVLAGRYCNDLAERFSFTGIPSEKIEVQPDIAAAAQALRCGGSEQLYAVTCFSDRDKLLALVEKEA